MENGKQKPANNQLNSNLAANETGSTLQNVQGDRSDNQIAGRLIRYSRSQMLSWRRRPISMRMNPNWNYATLLFNSFNRPRYDLHENFPNLSLPAVALDVEAVTYLVPIESTKSDLSNKLINTERHSTKSAKEKTMKGINMAATVSIVDQNLKMIYNGMLYHKPGQFLVDHHTIAVNGFRQNSLVQGRPFAEVREQVLKVCTNKLVVLFNAPFDRVSLELFGDEVQSRNIQFIDLMQYFQIYNSKADNYQAISLRALVQHYFGDKNFQAGHHDARSDAMYTMRLFNEVFLPDRFSPEDQIKRIPKVDHFKRGNRNLKNRNQVQK